MEFLDVEHERCFYDWLVLDDTDNADVERISSFLVLSSVHDIRVNIASIYDFSNHTMRPTQDTDASIMSDAAQALLKLARHFFNCYKRENDVTIMDSLWPLDNDELDVAIQAIRIRLGKN
jgi:hypothetical protein